MKNILDKFEKAFDKAKNVTQGIDDAFDSLPDGFVEIDNIIEGIIREKSRELFSCEIQRSDFDIYYNMSLSEARKRLDILNHQLDFLTDEIDQDVIMARHALSGKFGNSPLIQLK